MYNFVFALTLGVLLFIGIFFLFCIIVLCDIYKKGYKRVYFEIVLVFFGVLVAIITVFWYFKSVNLLIKLEGG